MANNGTKTRQSRLIAALLDPANRSQADACAAVGVPVRTLQNWLADDPGFLAALRAAESAVIDAAGRRLLGLVDDAIDAIGDLLKPGAADAIRLRAAGEVLDRLHTWRQDVIFEDRLAALEREIGNEPIATYTDPRTSAPACAARASG